MRVSTSSIHGGAHMRHMEALAKTSERVGNRKEAAKLQKDYETLQVLLKEHGGSPGHTEYKGARNGEPSDDVAVLRILHLIVECIWLLHL